MLNARHFAMAAVKSEPLSCLTCFKIYREEGEEGNNNCKYASDRLRNDQNTFRFCFRADVCTPKVVKAMAMGPTTVLQLPVHLQRSVPILDSAGYMHTFRYMYTNGQSLSVVHPNGW